MSKITEDEFEAAFTMIKNHINDDASLDGCMFETYGSEYAYISSMEQSKRVWTFLEDDKGLYFKTGIQQGKRLGPIGYFITEQPYKKQTIVRLDWFH